MGMPEAKIYDHMVYDGLWDVFNDYHMGVTAENVAEAYGITREESDAYAVRSHQRAAKAHEEEQFDGQIVPVSSERKAGELGRPVAGRLVSAAVAGVDPPVMGTGMIPASRMALKKAGLSVDDLDAVEANEAFSSIAIAVGRELGVPEEKLNPVGGAVALGHPIGATGAVLTVKLLHHLDRTGGQYGLVTLCIGGGMGIAAVFERVS